MKFGKFLVIAAMLSMAVSAMGATTVHTSTLYDWVISDPVAVGDGSESLVGFTLSIVNNSGNAADNPQAFDAKASGFLGITGQLHVHDSLALAATTEDDSNPNYATAIDSHFLLAGVPFAFDSGTGAPAEDRLVAPSAEASDAPVPFDGFADTSFGSFLTMTGTRTGSVGNVWDLAYIVVPNGSLVGVHGQVASSAGVKDNVVETSFLAEAGGTGFEIPVPAALPMGLMGLALIRRR